MVPPCCKKLIHGRVASGVFSRCEIHSPCVHPYCEGRRHRFLLKWPTGLDNNRVALGCFANPSTATPLELDPTLKRWLRYCQDWGYGWSWTVNVRSWRATDPSDVPDDVLAISRQNKRWIRQAAQQAELIVCGWGKLGGPRGAEVLELLRAQGQVPHALRLNKDNSPAHPLYLPATCKPFAIRGSQEDRPRSTGLDNVRVPHQHKKAYQVHQLAQVCRA